MCFALPFIRREVRDNHTLLPIAVGTNGRDLSILKLPQTSGDVSQSPRSMKEVRS